MKKNVQIGRAKTRVVARVENDRGNTMRRKWLKTAVGVPLLSGIHLL